MRFLQVASRYQVQLGWLRVIAASIGDGRMGIEEVAEVLLSHRDRFNGWWEQTGQEGPARGIAQPATANRAARIGVTYGIHDPDSGRLTPIGQVLRHAVPWQRSDSPLKWTGGTRWLGLWLTMAAAGDVLLTVLRSWPEAGLEAEEAPDFLAELLRALAVQAAPDAARQLLDQAGRAGGKLRFARNFLIYPYLEPLRDLGYLRAAGRAGGYQLTGEGARLRAVLCDGRSADEWLEDGLHGAFLTAARSRADAPEPEQIAAQLASLPEVLRGPAGAEMTSTLLLVQARLSAPGAPTAVLELRAGRAMLTAAAARSGGRLLIDGDRLRWGQLDPTLWSSTTPAPTPASMPVAVPQPRASAPLPPAVGARGWLQATAALLQPPAPGRSLCWGGPRTALHRLRQWLSEGRPRAGAPLAPLRSALAEALEGRALLQRVVDRWDSPLPDDALLATLRRAQLAADADRLARVARLKANLSADDVPTQTAALLGDALAVDGWQRAELLDQLCRRIAELGEEAAPAVFLDDLIAEPTPHTYVRLLDIPLPTGRLDGVEIAEGPGGQKQAWLTLPAPCPAAALRTARATVDAVLQVCCYAARLPLPTSAPSETLSPPPPLAAPVPEWLLLPAPARPPLPIARLDGPLLPLATAVAAGGALPDTPALPQAVAIAGLRCALIAAVSDAEVALHRLALATPDAPILAAIADWRGEEAAAAYRDLAELAPLLRPLKLAPPPARSLPEALACLPRAGGVCAVLAAEYPGPAASLAGWAAALQDPARWSIEAATRQESAARMLQDGPPSLRAALLDPVLAEAAASADGALHWGAILDRYDDLTTLTAPPSAGRLAEILGA